MIVYFTDRFFTVLGVASTELPQGYRIVADRLFESLDDGVNTFECEVVANDNDVHELKELASEGRFLIRESHGRYNTVFQITEAEWSNDSVRLYGEDCGLQLLNMVVPEQSFTDKTITQMIQSFITDWTLDIDPDITGTKTVKYEGENTGTNRLASICNAFNAEFYFDFDIEGFVLQSKTIHILPKRGSEEPVCQLRVGIEIDNIVTQSNINNLATALLPKGKDNLDLKNYDYSYTDAKGDVYTVHKPTGQMRCTTQMNNWISAIDSDGLIVQSWSYDTSSKATLAGQARAALQKMTYPEVTYEVDFITFPDDIKIGDRVNIIDDDQELYLDSRVLELETSEVDDKVQATLGDHKVKPSGMSPLISSPAAVDEAVLSITSKGGNVFHGREIDTELIATVFYMGETITTQEELEAALGAGAEIRWYAPVYGLRPSTTLAPSTTLIPKTYGAYGLFGTGFSIAYSSPLQKVQIRCDLYTEGGVTP